jgi:L-amino acid N-acyltransferase YncA
MIAAMASFRAHRATDQDIEALRRLCAEATGGRGALWGSKREHFDPAAWHAARAPLAAVADGPAIVGFAAALAEGVPFGAPRCAEALVYVTPAQRRRGVARAAMSELIVAARATGLWKLVSYTFADDLAGIGLLARLDFRVVGTLVKHVQVEGSWRDVALHERLVLAARKSQPSIPDA